MGDNTLATVQQGTVGNPEQVNQFKEALSGDILPRNAQGETEDKAGSVGRDSDRFSNVSTQEINLFGNIKMRGTLTTKFFSTNGSWTCPDGVHQVVATAYAGGGGGGADYVGVVPTGGGGGGFIVANLQTEAGDTIAIQVGSGGSGGYAGSTSSSAPGSSGGDTIVSLEAVEQMRAKGGVGGKTDATRQVGGPRGGGASFVSGLDIRCMVAGGQGGHFSGTSGDTDAGSGAGGMGGTGRNSGGGGGQGDGGGSTTSGTDAGGGGGYYNGSSGTYSAGSWARGGSGGAGAATITYWLPDGVTDPN